MPTRSLSSTNKTHRHRHRHHLHLHLFIHSQNRPLRLPSLSLVFPDLHSRVHPSSLSIILLLMPPPSRSLRTDFTTDHATISLSHTLHTFPPSPVARYPLFFPLSSSCFACDLFSTTEKARKQLLASPVSTRVPQMSQSRGVLDDLCDVSFPLVVCQLHPILLWRGFLLPSFIPLLRPRFMLFISISSHFASLPGRPLPLSRENVVRGDDRAGSGSHRPSQDQHARMRT